MDITDEVLVLHVTEDDPEAIDPDEAEGPEDSKGTRDYYDDFSYLGSVSSFIDSSFLNIVMGLNDLNF